MEIHHHPHLGHKAKPWKEYLLEGLMIFIAVTLGFFAEGFREQINNHEKEREYMITMLEDLRGDSIQNTKVLNQWVRNLSDMDSVADAITLPLTAFNLPKAYRHLSNALDFESFYYNDRTIAQLKNSGAFRLIRDGVIANSIIAYDQLNNNEIKNIYLQFNGFYENTVRLRNKAFVQSIINKIYQKSSYKGISNEIDPWIEGLIRSEVSPLSKTEQETVMFEFKNALLAYRRDFENMRWGMDQLQKRQNELIELIKKSYELE